MDISRPSAPDRTWIESIRAGDHEAFEALFHAFYPSLCSFVTRRLGAPEIAEEVAQDVFVRVWQRREALDPEQSIAGYLYRAARNQVLDQLKHRRVVDGSNRTGGGRLNSSQPTPEDHARCSEISTAVQDAIDQLPDRCREIFLLSRQCDLKYAEIAQMLGISVKTVETQMGRALKALRSALAPYI